MEAIILAGGKAERLGAAAQGRPKALVPVAGRPLAAYQVALLASAGVTRVIVSCAAGQEELFEAELAGLGPEIASAPESEPLGRGGGIRLAAQARQESGPVYVLNGDELIHADLAALLDAHRAHGGAATLTVARMPTGFGVVELEEDDRVSGSRSRRSSRTGCTPAWTCSTRRRSSGFRRKATTSGRPFRSSRPRGSSTHSATRASG